MADVFVPAHGEVLVWMWPDTDAEEGELPYFLDMVPVVAWRICAAGPGVNETWGEPVLPRDAQLPTEASGVCMMALLMPTGKLYSLDGDQQCDSVEEFTDRWREFYEVKMRARIERATETP
jgi:hypothetical protein